MSREDRLRQALERPPGARILLEGVALQGGLALGMAAPLHIPVPGTPLWMDPRLFARDEEELATIEYRMPTDPVEVVAFCQDLREVPPVLAPYVRVVAWVVESPVEPPLPPVPVVQVARLPRIIPPDVPVVVDGYVGLVFIEPDEKAMSRYQARLTRTVGLTRYFLEEPHLPATTWDGHKIAVGGWVERSAEVEGAVQAGADFVGLSTSAVLPMMQEPADRDLLLHRLGGKPLWLFGSPETPPPAVLWQLGARCALTFLLVQPSDRAPRQVERWWQGMQLVREGLRARRAEIGELKVGVAIQWRQGRRRPPRDAESQQVQVLCWLLSADLWQKPQQVGDLLESHLHAMRRGLRRALYFPTAEATLLAKALALQPHALLLPSAQVQEAKRTIPLLGQEECREWLLEWLNHPDREGHESKPLEWIEQRLSRT